MQLLRAFVIAQAVLPAMATSVWADDLRELMGERYIRYQFCMEKRYGHDFYGRLKLEAVINRWGVMEPRMRSLRTQAREIRGADEDCRKASELQGQPRPW